MTEPIFDTLLSAQAKADQLAAAAGPGVRVKAAVEAFDDYRYSDDDFPLVVPSSRWAVLMDLAQAFTEWSFAGMANGGTPTYESAVALSDAFKALMASQVES